MAPEEPLAGVAVRVHSTTKMSWKETQKLGEDPHLALEVGSRWSASRPWTISPRPRTHRLRPLRLQQQLLELRREDTKVLVHRHPTPRCRGIVFGLSLGSCRDPSLTFCPGRGTLDFVRRKCRHHKP